MKGNFINLRRRAGLNQKQLAIKCNVKQSTISRIETGKAIPSFSLIFKLAYALKVCPNKLIKLFICSKCPLSNICNKDLNNPYLNLNLKH